jgi:hypothetical protein
VGQAKRGPTIFCISGLSEGIEMGKRKPRGICDGCGKSPCALSQIESGQWVCHACLKEIRGPRRSKNHASFEKIEALRLLGFEVTDDLTKQDYRRLQWIQQFRLRGIKVRQHATLEDLNRLEAILDLRNKGIDIPLTATASQVESAIAQSNRIRHFFTKVAGVSHKNRDGTRRQRILANCIPLEQLVLIHEDENPFDPNAIAVKRQNGEQIGYLRAELATEVAENNKLGYKYTAFITMITGGADDSPTLGCNLLVIVCEPNVSNQEGIDYINRVLATDKDLLADIGVTSLSASAPDVTSSKEMNSYWERLFRRR